MSNWKERAAMSLPRAAVVVHDLAMVWVAWTGLHLLRYALRSEPSPLSPWSAETIDPATTSVESAVPVIGCAVSANVAASSTRRLSNDHRPVPGTNVPVPGRLER